MRAGGRMSYRWQERAREIGMKGRSQMGETREEKRRENKK
jgi:hypothetical protein